MRENNDDKVDLTDGIFALNFLFQGGAEPKCMDAVDANDDGKIDITDPIYTLNYLFVGGKVIPAPYPEYDADPTPDDLPCEL